MKKQFIGTIVSDKMTKTVIVSIERRFRHGFYKKVITRHKKFKAHNEDAELKVGDKVLIMETRPISKDTHFTVVKKITKKDQNISKEKKSVKKTSKEN